MRAIITKDNRILKPLAGPMSGCLGCDCISPGREEVPCSHVQEAGENCRSVVWQEVEH